MVECPKCKSGRYDILYVEGYDYDELHVIVHAKVECAECGKKFWVKERFIFDGAKNEKGE